ncbi:MAG: S-layer homology domain-containing protein [Acutalibacter sp.]|nr:S-layer homology domain-containing protein [Acutalibacter sp.]
MRKDKLLAGILVFCLLLGMLPITAAADTAEDTAEAYYTTEENGSITEDSSGEDSEDDPEKDPEGDPEDEPETEPEKKPAPTSAATPKTQFTPLEGYLETEDHLVYISGDDDLVHPDGNLTRSEAAVMIYSLLRTKPEAAALHFADVPEGAWYQKQVDALAELGIVVGAGESLDGPLYKPNAKITRAEFVTILSKFYPRETGGADFTDLDPKAWHYPFMVNAILKGWLSGYGDGTVRPNRSITRAEAISLLNRMLGRSADKAEINAYDNHGKIFRFIDLPLTHWAYYDIMEASIPHTPKLGYVGGEVWTEFTVPVAVREPGYRLYSGSLYKVNADGCYVRDLTDGVLRFGSDGKYTTGNDTLDSYLRSAVRSNTVDSDTLENNWKRLYKYAGGSNFRYLAREYLNDGQTGWEVDKALQMFQTRKGNCYNYAAVTMFLARSMGYQATALAGYAYMPQNGHYVGHGWTQITIDGVDYVADPELQYVFVEQNGGPSWDLFMKRYSSLTVPIYRWKGVVLQ